MMMMMMMMMIMIMIMIMIVMDARLTGPYFWGSEWRHQCGPHDCFAAPFSLFFFGCCCFFSYPPKSRGATSDWEHTRGNFFSILSKKGGCPLVISYIAN